MRESYETIEARLKGAEKAQLRMVEVIERQYAEIGRLKAEIERLNSEAAPPGIMRRVNG